MLTAMTIILLLALALLVVGIVVGTIRDIHDDGYGRRPPPRSHFPDPFDPGLHMRH